ncbi:MarR family winged helix-turn-helix transcriptional regulator [Candidatus Protofrankia datiscae]|uniref:MarR family winged helix-turn-helix transcriptional regulator n=2 Tax=Frankiaceae TaxID=74712 RepID=UPI001ED905E3|nr:MarR family transcriptional regulator [Candidatus Protofrankia datiscae]
MTARMARGESSPKRCQAGDIARRSGYDLPQASWSLLEYLDARGALRVSDIAACHGVDISSITPRLKKLERAGLIARGRVATDARAFLISITPEGVQALESVHAARREILGRVVGGTDPARLAVTADVLSCVALRLADEPAPVTAD